MATRRRLFKWSAALWAFWGSVSPLYSQTKTMSSATDDDASLYMLQKPFEPRGDIQLGYGYGILNPYQNLHHFLVKGNYRLNSLWQVGASLAKINASENNFSKALAASAGAVEIRTEYQNPERTMHATVGFIPINGLLNLFSKKVIPFELVVGAKAGLSHYRDSGDSMSVGLSLEYKFYLWNRWGLFSGIEYAAERLNGLSGGPSVWIAASHMSAGLTWAY